jgi:hypothetical protein
MSEDEIEKFHVLEQEKPFSCMRIQEFEDIEISEVYGLLKGLVMKDIRIICPNQAGESYAG